MHRGFGEQTIIVGHEPSEEKGLDVNKLIEVPECIRCIEHVKDFLNCYYYFSYEILRGFHRHNHNDAQMLFHNYNI